MIIGNGGSAAEAQHFSAELVGWYDDFEHIREPLPALALTTDTSIITAIANDKTFEDVFARQIRALGKEGDIVIGLSTSGKSKNILYAYKWAKMLDIEVIDFPRKGKGTAQIQENQLKMIHKVCSLVVNAFPIKNIGELM